VFFGVLSGRDVLDFKNESRSRPDISAPEQDDVTAELKTVATVVNLVHCYVVALMICMAC